jgi:hypothetical protein
MGFAGYPALWLMALAETGTRGLLELRNSDYCASGAGPYISR